MSGAFFNGRGIPSIRYKRPLQWLARPSDCIVKAACSKFADQAAFMYILPGMKMGRMGKSEPHLAAHLRQLKQ